MKNLQRPLNTTTVPIRAKNSVDFFERSFRKATFDAFAPVNKCKLNVICVLSFYLNHTRRFMLQR